MVGIFRGEWGQFVGFCIARKYNIFIDELELSIIITL